MRALVQRVKWAKVTVGDKAVSSIDRGFLTLLGISVNDTEAQVEKLIQKVNQLRIFEDESGKMNRSLADVGGQNLIVSQFTLYADTSKGNRPSFIAAARPEVAKPLYERAIELSRAMGIETEGGVFQADMQIELLNDGPVTLMLEVQNE